MTKPVRYQLALLKNARMFQKAHPKKRFSAEGNIVVACADGHQMFDLYRHLLSMYYGWFVAFLLYLIRPLQVALKLLFSLLPSNLRELIQPALGQAEKLVRKFVPLPFTHLLTSNGGALMLSSHWPNVAQTEHLIQQVRQAKELKKCKSVILYVHVPCGAAGLYGLDAIQVIDWLIDAKIQLKKADPELEIACFIHVDWGFGKRRTYFISKKAWLEFRSKQPNCAEVPAHLLEDPTEPKNQFVN